MVDFKLLLHEGRLQGIMGQVLPIAAFETREERRENWEEHM